MNDNLPACPLCLKDDQILSKNDQVRRVSSVVQEGTATYPSEFWTSGPLPTPSAPFIAPTDPAQLLRMPSPPQANTSPGKETAIGCGVAFAAFWLFALIAALANFSTSLQVPLIIVTLLGWGVWVIRVLVRHSENKAEAAKLARSWPAAERVWNDDLYYCFRRGHGAVFRGSNPSICVPGSEMIMLLIDAAREHSNGT
jgi:hypothetical protein